MASHLDVETNSAGESGNEDCEIQDQQVNDEIDDDEDVELLNMSKETVMGMVFESLDDAENFYKKYAYVNNFRVRMEDVYWNKDGEAQSRRMVCSAKGKRKIEYIEDLERKKEHRTLTRSGCTACMRVRKNKREGVWEVFRFDDDHNHRKLAPTHTSFHRCHRKMVDADVAQVDTMQSYGFKGSQIYGYIAGQAGGYEKVGFIKKDLYNHISREPNSKTNDGDVMAALHYLQGKVDSDPSFFMKYTVDTNGCLEHLFWADGCSRVDFKCFGDVLAFDLTYKKNKYDKPVVIFSGVNHHRNTIVFGCAIVANEREETYKWLLQTLLEVNDGKEPRSVITDSDKAIINAIKHILPQCTHRLCTWHLQRNATSNIVNPQFTKRFKNCMFGNINIAQFELKWRSLIQDFGVENNCHD